jgi:hypothetical protein
MKIADVLEDGKYQNGAVVWEDRIDKNGDKR